MTLEVEFWTLVSLSITFLGAIIGVVWGLARGVLNQALQRLDERFSALGRRLDLMETTDREEAGQWHRIEREVAALKADLPISYVRRDDYVQSIATIMAKLDAMYLKFENIILRGGRNHE